MQLAREILVPQPGIKPASPALEEQSLNHWTSREVPCGSIFLKLRVASDFCSLSMILKARTSLY